MATAALEAQYITMIVALSHLKQHRLAEHLNCCCHEFADERVVA